MTRQVCEGQTEGQGQTSRDDSEVSGLSEAGSTEGQGLRKKMMSSGKNAESEVPVGPGTRCLAGASCTETYH